MRFLEIETEIIGYDRIGIGNYRNEECLESYEVFSRFLFLSRRGKNRKNDLAVARAYGWEKFLDDESSIAVELLKLYQNQTYLQEEK